LKYFVRPIAYEQMETVDIQAQWD